MGLFSKKKTLREQSNEWKRKMRTESRNIDKNLRSNFFKNFC